MRGLGTLSAMLALLVLLVGDALAQGGARGGGKGRGAQAGQIRCGITGCFEIPKGCRGEMRHSGTGQVVVMHCQEHRPQGNNLH